MPENSLFNSFWIGGLECSSHRLGSGKRLDVLNDTRHEQFYEADYARLFRQGFRTIRSGIRWHRIETTPGHYDFSSVIPMIRAAQTQGIQVIWDICHYGWPDDLDLMSPEFVRRFAGLSKAFAHILHEESDTTPFLCPINEISFFAWGAGDAGYLNPFQRGRGFELKVQLVTAALEGIEAIWSAAPDARIVHVDPVIQIIPDPGRPYDHHAAEGHRVAQYQAWDMLCGKMWPHLGGDPKYLDIIGLNYYPRNQWIHGGHTLGYLDPLYRPFRQILLEVYERYQCPLFIGETGAEDEFRGEWLRYVGSEAAEAIRSGVPLEGLCLYPILNHPGWDNDRHCHNGLWDYANDRGERDIYQPLADAITDSDSLIQHAQAELGREAQAREERIEYVVAGDRPLHVCLFTDSLEASGMGEHMLTLAAELHADHQVTLIMPPSQTNQLILARATALGLRVMPLEVRGQSRHAWETLRDFLRDQHVDIFHAHAGISWEGHDGFYAARFARVPVLLRTEHLPYLITDPGEKRAYAALVARADHLICVSAESCRSYLRAGVPAEKLTAIHNGIRFRPSRQSRQMVRAGLGIEPNAPLILTAGRLTDQKGHRYLLDAIPNVLAKFPEARFIWAGDGPLYGELCARLEQLDLTEQVSMLGWHSDVHDLMSAADLFVLPSLFEGLPIVILEALAAGKPVVATRVGGTPEIMTHHTQGALVDPGDSAALATAICEALSSPSLRQTWATAGRRRYEEAFSAERMASETSALYRRLLQERLRIWTALAV